MHACIRRCLMCRFGIIAHAARKFLMLHCPLSAQGHEEETPSAMDLCRLHMLVCVLALCCRHAASGSRPAHGLQDAPAACLTSRAVDSAEGRGGRGLPRKGWVRHTDRSVDCASGCADAVGLAGICVISQHHLHCDGRLPESRQCLHCTCNGLSGNHL